MTMICAYCWLRSPSVDDRHDARNCPHRELVTALPPNDGTPQRRVPWLLRQRLRQALGMCCENERAFLARIEELQLELEPEPELVD